MRLAVPFLVLAVLIAGCDPGTDPALHEIQLYGAQNTRLTYAYGAPATLMIGDVELTLTEGKTDDPLDVLSAALIDGQSYLREPIETRDPPARVRRIPLTTDLIVTVEGEVEEVAYFDGDSWFTLVQSPDAGFSARVVPVPRVGRLRGLGALSREEADVLAAVFEDRDRPFALTLLPEEGLERRAIDGLSEYLVTGLYIEEDLQVDVEAFQPSPQTVLWEPLGQGSQATGVEELSFFLVRDRPRLIDLWTRGHGAELSPPAVPEVDFDREAVIAVFLGERPTGGYGLRIDRVDLEGNDLFVDLVEVTPAAGSVTTQALTSPWLMIRVLRGGIDVAWFRDPETDALIGVARSRP